MIELARRVWYRVMFGRLTQVVVFVSESNREAATDLRAVLFDYMHSLPAFCHAPIKIETTEDAEHYLVVAEQWQGGLYSLFHGGEGYIDVDTLEGVMSV